MESIKINSYNIYYTQEKGGFVVYFHPDILKEHPDFIEKCNNNNWNTTIFFPVNQYFHNENGPSSENLITNSYNLFGKEYSKTEWEKEVKRLRKERHNKEFTTKMDDIING
jgi:hypothetical protein